jgi:hypothetical protein
MLVAARPAAYSPNNLSGAGRKSSVESPRKYRWEHLSGVGLASHGGLQDAAAKAVAALLSVAPAIIDPRHPQLHHPRALAPAIAH